MRAEGSTEWMPEEYQVDVQRAKMRGNGAIRLGKRRQLPPTVWIAAATTSAPAIMNGRFRVGRMRSRVQVLWKPSTLDLLSAESC
jgi:hypothetical protein